MNDPERRITQGQIIRALLERGSSEHSSVTLSRNSKGETQIEVIVRTDDRGSITSPAEAEQVAREIYDRLQTTYPYTGTATAAT
jgi:hypothetical protein